MKMADFIIARSVNFFKKDLGLVTLRCVELRQLSGLFYNRVV